MAERGCRDLLEEADGFRLLSVEDRLGIADVGTVCVVVWQGTVTPSRFKRQRDALQEAAQRHPGRAALLCVVEPTTPPPEDAMRNASIDLIASLSDRLSCVACVIEGTGFRAADTRNVLSGMSLRLACPPEVLFAATVAEAAPWVVQRCDGVSCVSLTQAHQQLCRELKRAPIV
jgi:hypothetical protein